MEHVRTCFIVFVVKEWTPRAFTMVNNVKEVDEKCVHTKRPPTLTGAGHQWTVSTNTGCTQWLSLAKPALKVAPTGRNRSLVACTSKCGGLEGVLLLWAAIFFLSRVSMRGDSLFMCYFWSKLIGKLFFGSLHEDLGEDPGSWIHIKSTLSIKSMWLTLIISTLIFHPH